MSINLKLYKTLVKNLNIKQFEDDILFYSFLGVIIKNGGKNKADLFIIKLLMFLKKKYPHENPKKMLYKALIQVKPVISLKIKKVAGINYQLPSPINNERACKLAVNWFFKALITRNEKGFFGKITGEILDLLRGKGLSKQKKESLEKVAMDNRPFIFFLKR